MCGMLTETDRLSAVEPRKSMSRVLFVALLLSSIFPNTALATIFGVARGIMHYPLHRPVEGAVVTLKAISSDWSKATISDEDCAAVTTNPTY